MIYTGSQNYINTVVGKHGIQTLIVVVVFLSLQMHISYYFWTNGLSIYTYTSDIIIKMFIEM